MNATCEAMLPTHHAIITCTLPTDHAGCHEHDDHIWINYKGSWYWNHAQMGNESQEAYATRIKAMLDESPAIL